MARITIDDGTREYELCNQYGTVIAKLHFRPADFSLAERFNSMRDEFAAAVRPLEHISINEDGTAAEDEGIKALHDADIALRASLNRLLDTEDADEIFKTRNPFSVVGGKFFAERVIDALGQIITEAIDEETKASAERMSKYIEGGVSDAGRPAENA